MFLSKLEIFGFKSFANKTNIGFNRGITGIVGPNGCGKTNIVDAIRWVLGEQKTATLRSDKMENVIFNGTREKKPMGMSEVSLTLVNDHGVLPTDYSEVTITRRIFRSGESEYLLNKNICRLKDITNLFMDTGIGANAYSVIELKMIEIILSSKTEERRKLFEEAAGVNKYKLRRRLSLKKLEDVKADLTRVNDIVSEVEKTVRSLERQAKRADQYSQIQSVLREKEIDLGEREYAHLSNRKQTLAHDITEHVQKKNQIDLDIRKIENELIHYRNEINAIDTELQAKRDELADNTERLHNTQKNISVSEERLKSLLNNHERLEKEIVELHHRLEETKDYIVKSSEELENLSQKLTDKTSELSSHESTVSQKREELDGKRGELKQLNEDRFNLMKDISEKENNLSSLQKELASYNATVQKLNQKIQSITNTIAKTVGFIEELHVEKDGAEKKLKETGLLIALREKEKEELELKTNQLKENEIEEKTLLAALKEKIEFFQTLISNLEGVSKGAKVLLENNQWTKKNKNIFADVGNTQEKYRFALEAALRTVLNNLLIDSVDDLQNAVDYLRNNDLGKASFYLLRSDENVKKTFSEKLTEYSAKRKAKRLSKEESFIGWAKDFVETDSKWQPYFEQILSRIAVTASLKSAVELSRRYPAFSFTTLDGDFVQSNGVIEGGSLPKQDETLFGRRQLLENLKKEYPKHESNVEKIKAEIAEIEAKISKIDLKNLSDAEKLIASDIANIEKQISQFEYEKNKAGEEVELTQKEIHEVAEKANLLDNQINEIQKEIDGLNEKKKDSDDHISSHEIELNSFEEEFSKLVDYQNELKLELERTKGQIENSKNSIERSENDKVSIERNIEKRRTDLSANESETNSLKGKIGETNLELNTINSSREELIVQEKEVSDKLKAIKDEAAKYENELNSLRDNRQEVSDQVHASEIKENEINLRIENLIAHIKENYSIDIELKQFEDLETFNFEATTEEVQKLKEKIRNIGPVNLLAYSEYEEEKKRLDFLHKQRDDLVESEKDLINTINEINETAQKLFLDTFDQIRKNFISIFQTLFNPGDEADLSLEEGIDPLEGKIEIMAKPKGKRPTSIELLSGGEKTLTATALLFAIYLVKPSPFCILDEVDAPLDDANIDRFTKLIKEFSKNTQFIIVTHNKRTMEASETMYGVTMQEEGVSKLVGVRFEEIPQSYEPQ
ncbi:MAG: chromosome segregation protein SMC [Bacteroidota bacterium]